MSSDILQLIVYKIESAGGQYVQVNYNTNTYYFIVEYEQHKLEFSMLSLDKAEDIALLWLQAMGATTDG